MRPLRLSMANIGPYEAVELNLAEVTAAAIVGPNGAGKSMLAGGIHRALYSDGNSIIPAGIIRNGCTEAHIQLDFEHQGTIYRVLRRGGKRPELHLLQLDDVNQPLALTCQTSAETQARIDGLLQMDEELYLATCCILQEQAAGFCGAKPAERKALLYRVYTAELDRYLPLEARAKEQARLAAEVVAAKRSELVNLEAQAAELDAHQAAVADVGASLVSTRAWLQEAQEAHQKAVEAAAAAELAQQAWIQAKADVLAKRNQVTACTNGITAERHRMAQLVVPADLDAKQAAVAELPAAEAGLVEHERKHQEQAKATEDGQYAARNAQAELATVNVLIARQEGQLASATANLEAAKKQAGLLDDVPCKGGAMQETCLLLASARQAANGIPALVAAQAQLSTDIATNKALREEHQAAVEAAGAETQAKLEAIGYDAMAHHQAQDAIRRLRVIKAAVDGADAVIRQRDLAQGRVDALEAQLATLQSEEAELTKRLGECSTADDGRDGPQLIAARDRAQAELRNAEASERGHVALLAACQERLQRAQEAQERASAIKADLSGLETEAQEWNALCQAFGRDGIPALIIDAAIPRIQEEATRMLGILTDNRMSIRLATQRETGRGIRESLDIWVDDGEAERPFETYSGGEKVRIALAVRVAISQLLAERAGATIRTLTLDEVCAPLDDAGEAALVDCVERLQGHFDCILLITHRESLRDRLPQQIEVRAGQVTLA